MDYYGVLTWGIVSISVIACIGLFAYLYAHHNSGRN